MKVVTVRPRARRLTGFGCGTAILTAGAVCLAVLLIATAVFHLAPASATVSSSVLQAQPGSLPWNPTSRLTVLLLGLPGTSTSGAPSDSMTVLSLDPATRTGAMVSLPATLWVTIPGFGPGEISQATADGGPHLALLVTQSVLHVPIPYYAVLNYSTFRKIVDAFGGVTVRVPRRARLGQSGRRTLTSALALTYIRAGRAAETGPTGRMWRVRQVLFALKDESGQATNLVQIPTMLNAFGADIPSNFPFNQVPVVARVLQSVPDRAFRILSLEPATGTVSRYGRYLLPDWQAVQSQAQAAIPPPASGPGGGVSVLNATNQQGAAATLSTWLEQARVPVHSYSSAPFSAQHTHVVLNTAAQISAPALGQEVSALLQVPLGRRAFPSIRAPVVVIIGQDFQDPTQN